MPISFLHALHLRGEVSYAEAARRLAGCLGIFRRHGLDPMSFAEDAWQSGEQGVFGGTTLVHKEFATRANDPFWGAGFMWVPAPQAVATVVTMTTPAGSLDEVSPWRWLLPLAEEVSEAIGAEIALINGFTLKRGRARGATPAGREVAPGHPPRVLCPWMYWCAARLVEDGLGTDTLARLPAARSSPSPQGGWVLQAHEEYSSRKPVDLQQACASAWGPPRDRGCG